jgi:hypothetical protein
MRHQQVTRLAAARPKSSCIASVWEISYRRVLRAGSKQEILRADFKKVRIPNKREWIAPGESKPVPRGATNHRQGTLLLVGGLARGQGALHQDLHRVAMKNYQKSNVNNRRPGPTVGGRSQRWVSGAGPNRRARPMRKETMSGIWRSPVLKPKTATQSPQKITTSTPNIISDRCRRTERNRSANTPMTSATGS